MREPVDAETRKGLFHFFNVGKRQVKIFLEDILYIESLKEYVKIHTHDTSLVTKLQIGESESLLASAKLLRVHKSFIVNLDKVVTETVTGICVCCLSLQTSR